MALLAPDSGYAVVIDAEQWYRFKQELDKFDPELARSLRRRIKAAGETARKKVQATLAESSPDGGPNKGTGRRALIAATRVSVSFGQRQAGARIVTSGSRLPKGHEGLLKVYNKASFRHPVFERSRQRTTRTFTRGESASQRASRTSSGELAGWVTQKGRPYFGSVILKAMNEAVAREIFDAVNDAYRAIGATEI